MTKHLLPRRTRAARSVLRHALVAPAAVLVASGTVIAVTPTLMSRDAPAPVTVETAAAPTEDEPIVDLPARAPDSVEAAFSPVGPYAGYRQSAAEIPPAALAAYQRAAAVMETAAPTCNLDWSVLAAIGRIATDHGERAPDVLTAAASTGPRTKESSTPDVERISDTDAGRLDGNERYDVGVGPLQFLPAAWAVVAVDSDNDGTRDPNDLDDAALAAGVVVCGHGRDLSDPADFRTAALMFNTAPRYPALVARLARAYERSLGRSGGMTTVVVGNPPTPTSPSTTSIARPTAPTASATPTPSEVAEASSHATQIDTDPSDPGENPGGGTVTKRPADPTKPPDCAKDDAAAGDEDAAGEAAGETAVDTADEPAGDEAGGVPDEESTDQPSDEPSGTGPEAEPDETGPDETGPEETVETDDSTCVAQ